MRHPSPVAHSLAVATLLAVVDFLVLDDVFFVSLVSVDAPVRFLLPFCRARVGGLEGAAPTSELSTARFALAPRRFAVGAVAASVAVVEVVVSVSAGGVVVSGEEAAADPCCLPPRLLAELSFLTVGSPL